MKDPDVIQKKGRQIRNQHTKIVLKTTILARKYESCRPVLLFLVLVANKNTSPLIKALVRCNGLHSPAIYFNSRHI